MVKSGLADILEELVYLIVHVLPLMIVRSNVGFINTIDFQQVTSLGS